MKFTATLFFAGLVSTVMGGAYELCCCTKTQEDSGYFGCDRNATESIVNAENGYFKFTTHTWRSETNRAPYTSSDYIYATGQGGSDTLIGAKEMKGRCKKYQAGQACFSVGNKASYNYKGEKTS